MAKITIETLLKAANSSPDNDSSINMAKRLFLDEANASEFFRNTGARMMQIGEWKKNSSLTDYDLFDASGRDANSEPISVDKFIRIALYGAGKYDWVRVEDILDEGIEIVIVVRPSHDPTQPGEDSTSHFFWPEARNHFCLQLNEKTVAFYVIGLKEKQNTKFTDGLIESARNAAVANVGYYSGLQKAVWKQFCSNMLQIDEEKSD